jgi:hypothetical protein
MVDAGNIRVSRKYLTLEGPTAAPTGSIVLDAGRRSEVMFIWPLMPNIWTDCRGFAGSKYRGIISSSMPGTEPL